MKKNITWLEAQKNGMTFEEYLALPVDNFSFPAISFLSFRFNNIKTLKDLLLLDIDGLFSLRYIGKKNGNDIIDLIHKLGLHFSYEVPESFQNDNEKPIPIEALLSSSISILGLRKSVVSALKNEGIASISHIITKKKNDLANIQGISENVANEIINKIHSYGIWFVEEMHEAKEYADSINHHLSR